MKVACESDDDPTDGPSEDEESTVEPSEEDRCLMAIDEYDSIDGECTPNEFTLDCGEGKVYCVVLEDCVEPLIDFMEKDGLTCEQIESSGEPVNKFVKYRLS